MTSAIAPERVSTTRQLAPSAVDATTVRSATQQYDAAHDGTNGRCSSATTTVWVQLLLAGLGCWHAGNCDDDFALGSARTGTLVPVLGSTATVHCRVSFGWKHGLLRK